MGLREEIDLAGAELAEIDWKLRRPGTWGGAQRLTLRARRRELQETILRAKYWLAGCAEDHDAEKH